jgi:5'-nucleotidase
MQYSCVPEPCAGTQSTGQVVSECVNDDLEQLTDNWTIGNITLGDIMEILPFEDSLVVLELDGETIWAAFEKGLEDLASTRRVTSSFPCRPLCFYTDLDMHSRFPVIAGFRVEWDSRRPPGQRVLSIHLDP